MRVKSLAQEHNTTQQPGLLDPDSNAPALNNSFKLQYETIIKKLPEGFKGELRADFTGG